MQQTRSTSSTMDVAIIGLMSALVFVGTYFFKIPTAFGYTHLGDCMIILTVCLFGTRRGVLAGAIGAGLADFIGGYAVWVLPTMILKALWALILGSFMYKLMPNQKFSWLIGAIVGGVIHTAGYVFVNVLFYGAAAASVEILPNSIQSAAGVILGGIAYLALSKSPAVQELRSKFI
ncbi:MAG: ECF transporter S component [Lachnospiraceae bacterium]|nr:ECF transporter S component [Lachnospiraceae bacterium]